MGAAPGPSIRNASLFQHLWRTPDCQKQFYQLVRPNGLMTQNMEWIRLYRGATTWFAPLRLAKVLHLVNSHGSQVRCSRSRNTYVIGREPCTTPDHSLRWSFSRLRNRRSIDCVD